jgi:transcriptional regulator GlxA family with amidase domain
LRVAIFVFDRMNLLDFSGPREVFSAANRVAPRLGKTVPFQTYSVAPSVGPITTIDGTKILPDYTFEDAPAPDVVVVPGGSITEVPLDEKVVGWVKDRAGKAEVTMSVCTGALLLGKAGLLDGKEATTHHMGMAGLRKVAPTVTLRPDHRYVDAGRVITTAGVSAGLDGALHLVDRLAGREVAENAAKFLMEYPWRPDDVLITPVGH